MSSISTNSKGRTRLPPSWEPRAKCAPTKDRNPGQRGQTGFHSPLRQKLGLAPVPPSVRWGPTGRLPPPSPWQTQEAPRRWRTAETCPGSTRLWRSSCPSTRMPGAARALGTDTSCAPTPPKRQARPLPYSGPRLPVLARCFTLLGRAARHVWGHSGLQGRRGSARGGRRRGHGVPNLAEAGEARREAGTLRTTIPTRPCGKPRERPLPQHKLSRTKSLEKKNQ